MKKKFLFGKTWFIEKFKPGEPMASTWGVIIEKEIYSGKSKFQKIEIFKTREYERILAIDDLVQLSTRDEFVYHEMLVHPGLFYHQNPKIILIIGGGDGGVLREVVKHPVDKIYLCEIDKKVIEISRKYLPSVSRGGFSDKRLKIFIEDGLKFIKKYKNYFDVIIVDSTDYFGPAKGLKAFRFLRDVQGALKRDGIFVAQTGFFGERFGKKARKNIKKIFPFFKVHRAFVDCFPFEEHTFSFGSKGVDFDKISFRKIREKYQKLNLETRYYSPEIHFASKILPKYLEGK